MTVFVPGQVATSVERGGTQIAAKWLFVSVAYGMNLQGVGSFECFVTFVTLEWSFPSVTHDVKSQ